jgi:hypothetical protein
MSLKPAEAIRQTLAVNTTVFLPGREPSKPRGIFANMLARIDRSQAGCVHCFFIFPTSLGHADRYDGFGKAPSGTIGRAFRGAGENHVDEKDPWRSRRFW